MHRIKAVMALGNSSPMATNSEKSRRYDRQLRLWGDHGQRALEAASVCLVRATATGCEILKSLVLPGKETRLFTAFPPPRGSSS